MRTQFVTLALLLTSASSFAQTSTAEVEAALKQFVTEYNKSPYEFFKDRCTTDFRYTSGDGSFVLLPALLKGDEGRPSLESTVSNLKIFRSGNLAVVSGIHAFGETTDRKVAFTYTLEKQKATGSAPRWMFAASQHTPIRPGEFSSATADEAAIKNVIEQETAAFHQRKADKALSYWANVPYASHSYTEKGMGYVRGYTAISKDMKNVLSRFSDADKNVYKNHDYQIHVNGTSAWATYIIDVLAGDKKRQTHDARYLEKVNGTWKIVSVVSTPAP